MATATDKQHAHELIERVPEDRLEAALQFLESLVDSVRFPDEEEQAVVRSKEWFKHNAGTPFEDVAAEMGFSMEQIRNNPSVDEEQDTAA